MNRGDWWATVHGVIRSWIWLSDFHFTWPVTHCQKHRGGRDSRAGWVWVPCGVCRRGPGPENRNRALRGHSGKGPRLYSEERNRLDWHFISTKKRGYSLMVQWLGHQAFTHGSLIGKPRSCKPSGRAKEKKKKTKTATTTKHKSMKTTFSSVQFNRSVMSDSLRSHELQHARPRCPSPTPGVHSDSHPSSQWCHPAISSSVVPLSSCPQSLPASESSPMSQLFTWGGQMKTTLPSNKIESVVSAVRSFWEQQKTLNLFFW